MTRSAPVDAALARATPGPCHVPGSVGWLHRPMRAADLDLVVAVEVRAYSHPWSRGNFLDSLASGYHSELRLAADGSLIGYWLAMAGPGELHLLNITVAPEHQRRGHGQQLMQRLRCFAQQQQHQLLWLEVRDRNHGARALYRRLGFEEVGLRRGYYPAERGREDAVVMRLALSPPSPPQPGPAHHALD